MFRAKEDLIAVDRTVDDFVMKYEEKGRRRPRPKELSDAELSVPVAGYSPETSKDIWLGWARAMARQMGTELVEK